MSFSFCICFSFIVIRLVLLFWMSCSPVYFVISCFVFFYFVPTCFYIFLIVHLFPLTQSCNLMMFPDFRTSLALYLLFFARLLLPCCIIFLICFLFLLHILNSLYLRLIFLLFLLLYLLLAVFRFSNGLYLILVCLLFRIIHFVLYSFLLVFSLNYL